MSIQNTTEFTQELAQRDDALARWKECGYEEGWPDIAAFNTELHSLGTHSPTSVMRLTFRCKRKKAKYGETFMRALKDLQQPIMLNAHKNVFS